VTVRFALVMLSLGCGLSRDARDPDAGEVRDDAGFDLDVGVADAPMDSPVSDARVVDAPVEDAGLASDAGVTCECVPESECESAACVDGVCVRGPVDDGAECGELVMGMPSGVCIDGACRARGCGDGFVEPGPTDADPTAPPRESCDDGNFSDDDLCSSACESKLLELEVAAEGVSRSQIDMGRPNRMVAVDGRGVALVAYHVRDTARGPLYGQRFDASGVPIGERFTLLATSPPYAQVVGLPEGWLVLFGRDVEAGLAYRRVGTSGSVGAPVVFAEEPAYAAPDRVHGVATAQHTILAYSRADISQVVIKRYSPSGTLLNAFRLGGAPGSQQPSLAAHPDGHWAVTYLYGSLAEPTHRVMRFFEGTALDSDTFALAPSIGPGHSNITALRTPSGAAAYAVLFPDAGSLRVATLRPGETTATYSEPFRSLPALDRAQWGTIVSLDGGTDEEPAYLVAWLQGRHSYFLSSVPTREPESTALRAHLATARTGLSLVEGPRGYLFTWGDIDVSVSPLRLFLLPR
jgi:cysteine-rich repeat protein